MMRGLLKKSLMVIVPGVLIVCTAGFIQQKGTDPEDYVAVPLQSKISQVQPMTGIVLWEELDHKNTDAIQLEYSYMKYNDVVKEKGVYDWTGVENKLNSSASRSHQAILRFWDTYPGRESTVPDYIKALPDYKGTTAKSEKRDTGFPDWSNTEYKRFFIEFYQKFAEKYDNDPRLAFLETGFGLWSEYHVYDPGEIYGVNFPDKEFQATFFRALAGFLKTTPWMISEDAHLAERTPFASEPDLLKLRFGIFDDSFHLAWTPGYNLDGWLFFGMDRINHSPAGGEILFHDKERSDYVEENWKEQTRKFGITFMICEQWLRWITMDRIKEHGLACGYKFRITDFKTKTGNSEVTVENTGVAPIYYDAYVAVNGVRAAETLKYLKAGESRQFSVNAGGQDPKLTIECDHLVPGQNIEFDADLK
jgi:hypothetical protein